ncbi:Glycerol kinase [Rubripirellula tenax]|uniref:Glycerol kinase n=1 Tax=Rubripirellula tenax TaxID=2528015 RepID=A0A5C6F667_9BACT|nr:glycerol kinase GlpK [Rubripirellula tenax]TWU56858.1 Glycerol kinase [Rubripirellula tenax]
MPSVIMSLDQGTTSSRAILFDRSGTIVGLSQREFTQHYPKNDQVEHDADEIWQTQLAVAREAIQTHDFTAEDVAAIGITNQRETTVIWDRSTGRPIAPAIVWQDRRTAALCDQLNRQGHGDWVQRKTGLLIDSYFCATKIQWLLDNVSGARQRADRGELAFGTIDSWLIWNLTAGRVHATDVTNASRTMLLDIDSGQWDDELLQLFNVPRSLLPEVLPSSHLYGETDASLFGAPIAIGGAAGDQQSALFGQNCTSPGMAKNTYGTGCFALLNVGTRPAPSTCKLLTTMACRINEQQTYALEGSIFIAGAMVQWLRDEIGIIDSADEIEALAASVPDSGGVCVVPALAGLGAPHWDPYARGTIIGLTRGTTKAHIARAALEGIAFQVADVLEAMQNDAGISIDQLRVDGGAAANNLLMQFQADILGIAVVRPKVIETTAMGAAYLAGLSSGFWSGHDEIADVWQTDRVFQPDMERGEAARRRARWSDAVTRSRGWESSE